MSDKESKVDWEALRCELIEVHQEHAANFVCVICGFHPLDVQPMTRMVFKYKKDGTTYNRIVCENCGDHLGDKGL